MNDEILVFRLRRFVDNINRKGPGIVETMALTGQSLIQNRIQSKGVAGASYSKTKLPKAFLEGKELNKKGKKYIDGLGDEGGTHAELRAANGLQTEFVDLTFTGRMFGGTGLISSASNGNVFRATIGGSDSEVQDKLGWQVDRYGPTTFDPTKAEQKEVDEIALDFLENEFNSIFDE